MIKYRQKISAYTFRKYTRHIRQLLSHPSNDNKSSYQENMLPCQRGFGGRIFNLAVITSHMCEIFGCTEIVFDFYWLVKLLQRRSLSLLFPSPPSPPPPDFGVEAIGFMYCPTTCTHSSDLVRGKRQFLDGPLKEITSYKIVISNASSLVSARLNFCASSQR